MLLRLPPTARVAAVVWSYTLLFALTPVAVSANGVMLAVRPLGLSTV